MKAPYALTLSLVILTVSAARAASVPECQVQVLQAVTDDLGNRWNPGQSLPVDIERDNSQGGSFCATAGSCIPRRVHSGVAVRLANCSIGASITDTDHRLVPAARVVGRTTAQMMRLRERTSQRLSELGFSNAAAGSLADDYVTHPESRNGRLVASALAGSTSAVATLKRSSP